MTIITQVLAKIESGDRQASEELLPLVYDELRKLAAARMVGERPDHTLTATALVHEAYLRIVGPGDSWENQAHFFAAAANSMRQILVNWAHAKNTEKRGGGSQRVAMDDLADTGTWSPEAVLELDECLTDLANVDSVAAELVKLRLLAGLSVTDAGKVLNLSRSAAYDNWKFARAWFAARAAATAEEDFR